MTTTVAKPPHSDTVVQGSPLRAIGVLFLLVGATGEVAASIQYAQFFGGEVTTAQVLRIDESVLNKVPSYRYLVRLERPGGELAEAYLDSAEKLASEQQITVTYHRGARRELILGDGAQQLLTVQAFGATLLVGIVMLIAARLRARRRPTAATR